MEVIKKIKKTGIFQPVIYHLKYKLPCVIMGERRWNERAVRKKFREAFGYDIDLEHPRTLNEKLQWLKLNVHDDFHTLCADKYRVREFWKKFGEDGLIPLVYQTYNWRDIIMEHIPDYPCIVKCNSGCGFNQIIRDKNTLDIRELQGKCRAWLGINYYYISQEWQYKNIRPCILIEKLLLDKNGHIPNDYKLHFINGQLQFIYCSIDREGENYRSIYSPEWKRMDMEWVPAKGQSQTSGKEIPQPLNFEKMKQIGSRVAEHFRYVRTDFYEADGRLYYGEITLHHGSGYDVMKPEKYDLEYGKKLVL